MINFLGKYCGLILRTKINVFIFLVFLLCWSLNHKVWRFPYTTVEPPDVGSFSVVKDKRGQGNWIDKE